MTAPTTAAGRALVAILTNEAKLHHGVDKLSDNDLADILAIEAEARAAALDVRSLWWRHAKHCAYEKGGETCDCGLAEYARLAKDAER